MIATAAAALASVIANSMGARNVMGVIMASVYGVVETTL
jgi:hypothetical protein